MKRALDIITEQQLEALRDAGFAVIHRKPNAAMAKAFYAKKWPEEVNFFEGFNRMVATSIKQQNGSLPMPAEGMRS